MKSEMQTPGYWCKCHSPQSVLLALLAIVVVVSMVACHSAGGAESDISDKEDEEVDDSSTGKTVTAELILEQNDLTRFEGATAVAGTLEIDCPLCFSLEDLSEVKRIDGDLIIRNAESYLDLSALRSLVKVTGDLIIEDSEFSNGLEALDNLEEVGGKTVVQQCFFNQQEPSPVFPSLLRTRRVELRDLRKSFTDEMSAFSGFPQITSVADRVIVDAVHAVTVNVFQRLVQAGGNVEIRYLQDTETLIGFNALESIGGKLLIMSNRRLVELNNFSSLKRVEGEININGNELITNLDSFSSLTHVGGRLSLQMNRALQQIDGFRNVASVYELKLAVYSAFVGTLPFEGITSLEGDLEISGIDDPGTSLSLSLSGISNIIHIGGMLRLINFLNLTDLSDFANLKTLGGALKISWNQGLTSLHGLEGLQSIGGEIRINENHLLSDISAISHITAVGPLVDISDNFELPCCDICSFIQNLTTTPEKTITVDDLIDECYNEETHRCELE